MQRSLLAIVAAALQTGAFFLIPRLQGWPPRGWIILAISLVAAVAGGWLAGAGALAAGLALILILGNPLAIHPGIEVFAVVGTMAVFGVHRLQRAQAGLSANEERLRVAVEGGELGVWDLDLQSGRSVRSVRHDQCFGYEQLQKQWGMEIALRHVVPEDRLIVKAVHDQAPATGVLDYEVRVAWPDGRLHWIRAHGRVQYDWRHRPARISGVVADITERKAVEAERERLLQEARAANQAKDQVLATLSHELRTPLNVVLGHSRMLRSAPVTAERTLRACGIIERNAKLQLRMVEDLLDVQRMLRGGMQMEYSEFQLAPLGHSLIESLEPLAAPKQLHLKARFEDVRMEGDRARIQQVVWNLMTNAIKFTPSGGCVGIEGRAQGEDVVLRVSDSGEGIAPAFVPHVFEPFSQADMSTTRRHGGLGLGLAIAKHIVDAHRGAIEVRSELGKGTEFTVRLPRRASTRAA